MRSTVWLLVLLAACSDGFRGSAPSPTGDGGVDASLVGDGGTGEIDAATPIGDPCGDRSGLQADAPWPLAGGCPKRGNVASRAGPQSATVQWSAPIAAGGTSAAVSADGLVWVGTASGDAVALSAYSGVALAARSIATGAVTSSPALDKTGLALFGSDDGSIHGLALGGSVVPKDAGADSGPGDAGDAGEAADAGPPPAREPFEASVGGAVRSSPVIAADGTIVVTTDDGKVVALRPDGSTKLSTSVGSTAPTSVAMGRAGRLVVGDGDHTLHVLDPKDGRTVFTYDVGAKAAAPAVGGDDAIYVGASDGKLHAVGPDGARRWIYASGGAITGAPAVLGGVVYVGSADKKLHAISVVDGKQKWEYATLGAVATPAVASDGTIYVGSADGHLYALTPSGLLFFAVNVRGKVTSAPAFAGDGVLYVTTDTGVVAVGP